MTGTLHLELLNQVGELEKLAKALAEFGKAHGLHHRTLYAANLAAEELAINLLAYAWDDGQEVPRCLHHRRQCPGGRGRLRLAHGPHR